MRRLRAHRACAAAVAVLWSVAGAGSAQAYGIRVRWLHEVAGDVTGYRVHVWPDRGPTDPPHDVGVPAEDEDGTMSAVIDALEPFLDYSIAVSARFSDGSETPLSNVLRVTYADVAPFIDSDGDGLNDAADACPQTPEGGVVGPTGCACEELRCDDGDPCNGTETCADGACVPSPSADVPAIDMIVRRFVLRSTRGGRAWKLDAFATTPAGTAPPLVPTSASVEVAGHGAGMPFMASVAPERFAPRRNQLKFFAETEGAIGGLRRLEIAERGDFRMVRMQATLPPAALPAGPDAPIRWLVRIGETCARALQVVCRPAKRRFDCL